ncbi:unnamed protein product, partial [Prorocentrum cordatum]
MAPRRPGRALLAGAAALSAAWVARVAFVPAPHAAPAPQGQFNPTLAVSAALPTLMFAADAEAKYGDQRKWHSILVPLTTLIVPGIAFAAFLLYTFSDDFAWQLNPNAPKNIEKQAQYDMVPAWKNRSDPFRGLLNKDDFEKGLEEAWEKAKPAGSTVTVKQKLAEMSTQNNPHFMENKLAKLRMKARDVPQDRGRAAELWALAAAQGHAKAQYNLGVLYDTGDSVEEDKDARAMALWEQAAAQEHPDALFNLGCAYSEGEGVAE